MALINYGSTSAADVPDKLLALLQEQIQKGTAPATALTNLIKQIDQEVKAAGGFGSGAGDQVIMRNFGFNNPNEFNAFIAAGNDVSNPATNPILAHVTGAQAPKYYTPGSLIEGSANSITKEWPVENKTSNVPQVIGAQPSGTVLVRNDGVQFVADGRTKYDPKVYKTVSAPATDKHYTLSPQANSAADSQLQKILSSSGLTPDQNSMIQQIYDAISNNDTAQAERLKGAFNAATQYSEPYFKAQTLIVTDALSRALDASEGDLSYQEEKLQHTLSDLLASSASSREYLSFGHAQELSKLASSYEKDLEDTRQNLASLGKTSSSVRSKTQELLQAQNEGLVESSNRKYSYETNNLTNREQGAQRDYTRDINYLRDKAVQDRIAKLREAEKDVGSNALGSLGYQDLLGGVGGEMERKKVTDALSFSSSAGFLF